MTIEADDVPAGGPAAAPADELAVALQADEPAVAPVEELEPPPPPPPPLPLTPVSSSERVEVIDLLRGLALFGILAANIRGFAGPPVAYFMTDKFWPALHDRLAQAFIDTFVQGKFITIFAFLFGVGFAVQFDRALARGGKFGWRYAWRLSLLLVIGLIHGLLIWFGDILLTYAVTGFLLLIFRKRKDKTIAIWAVIFLLVPVFLMTGFFIAAQAGAQMPNLQPPADAIPKAAAIYENGTFLEIQAQRAKDAVTYNWNFLPVMVWHILGLFLLGVLAWRKRFFHPTPESLPRYRAAMFWGLVVGIPGNVVMVLVQWFSEAPQAPTTWPMYLMAYVRTISVPALSLAYICFVIVLCYDAQWRARLHRFAAVGRTALTNYLLQSIIGTLIFYNYGLGFFGAGPAILLPLTVVIFVAQLYASAWWVARYRFGPVEWLWRRLTYKGRLPMRREQLIAAPEEAAPA